MKVYRIKDFEHTYRALKDYGYDENTDLVKCFLNGGYYSNSYYFVKKKLFDDNQMKKTILKEINNVSETGKADLQKGIILRMDETYVAYDNETQNKPIAYDPFKDSKPISCVTAKSEKQDVVDETPKILNKISLLLTNIDSKMDMLLKNKDNNKERTITLDMVKSDKLVADTKYKECLFEKGFDKFRGVIGDKINVDKDGNNIFVGDLVNVCEEFYTADNNLNGYESKYITKLIDYKIRTNYNDDFEEYYTKRLTDEEIKKYERK